MGTNKHLGSNSYYKYIFMLSLIGKHLVEWLWGFAASNELKWQLSIDHQSSYETKLLSLQRCVWPSQFLTIFCSSDGVDPGGIEGWCGRPPIKILSESIFSPSNFLPDTVGVDKRLKSTKMYKFACKISKISRPIFCPNWGGRTLPNSLTSALCPT